jgi:hypothetical protein
MKKIVILKVLVVALFVVFFAAPRAESQVSVSVGVNLPVFPNLVVVPGYPVYYAPAVHGNYFFYDGLFWAFNVRDGYWYSSSWYNGPWVYVEPVYVPQPILVVPYRYYAVRPAYWAGWEFDLAPRWGVHWGHDWEVHRHGWEHWERRGLVAAPLPLYQREYVRERYPSPAQQVIIHKEKYVYKSQDVHVREVHATVLDRQSHGGLRARSSAEAVVRDRQERTVRGESGLDRGQGKDKGLHVEKGIREGKANPVKKGQVEEKGMQGRNGPHEDNGQHAEKGIHEGKAQPQKGQHENQKGQHENKGGREKGF